MGDRPQPRIFWDLDDTLNGLMRAWLDWHPRRFSAPARWLRHAELRENPPHRLLGLEESAYHASLDEFRLSDEARALPPAEEALAWFEQHGAGFEHHVLTARPVTTVPAASEWVFRHFGRWVRHFHFVPARRAAEAWPGAGETKGDVIARLGGADFFVDDSAENLSSARQAVHTCVLVPQPWNNGPGTLASALARLTPAEKIIS